MLQIKAEIGQTSEIPGETRIAHNSWEKCHISDFDRENLVMINPIWVKPSKSYIDFYRKGKTVVY